MPTHQPFTKNTQKIQTSLEHMIKDVRSKSRSRNNSRTSTAKLPSVSRRNSSRTLKPRNLARVSRNSMRNSVRRNSKNNSKSIQHTARFFNPLEAYNDQKVLKIPPRPPRAKINELIKLCTEDDQVVSSNDVKPIMKVLKA